MKTLLIKTLTSSLLITACLTSNTALAEKAKAGTYAIDPAHTSISFDVNHLGVSTLTGRFNTFEGEMSLKPDGKSSLEVSIETKSVDTNHGKRDDHLRSPDFFNVKQFPEMKFVSEEVTFKDGELNSIKGQLSLHGKKKEVTLSVTPIGAGNDPWGGYRAGYIASTTIQRSDFGMDFMKDGIGDDINISLNIEATKNK